MAESRDLVEESFDESPRGIASRLSVELAASRKELKKFHRQGRQAVERFRDERGDEGSDRGQSLGGERLNIFTAGIQIKQAILLGQLPKASVDRRFNDARDEPARIAAELWERVLNNDTQGDGSTLWSALKSTLNDVLLPGLGSARVAYVAEFRDVPGQPAIDPDEETGTGGAPEVPATQEKVSEDAEVYYVPWDDQLWSPCRTYEHLRWWASRNEMSQKQLVERFAASLAHQLYDEADAEDEDGNVVEGAKLSEDEARELGEQLAKDIPMNAHRGGDTRKESTDAKEKNQPWARAEVWEVWHKEDGRVYWYVDGYGTILDQQEDPLQLDGFWPFPEPLMTNLATDKLVPVSDFRLCEDLYREIDLLSTRITGLMDAVQVRGIYDQSRPEIGRILSEARGGQMIPCPNWEMFASKGGLAKLVDWFPLDPVVNALDKLWDKRQGLIDLVHQIDGTSDLMRGQQQENGTPGEINTKILFGSVKMRETQRRFARFTGELLALKAEVMAKHFDPQNIIKRANVNYMFDAPSAQQPPQPAPPPQAPVGAGQPGVPVNGALPSAPNPGLPQPNPAVLQAAQELQHKKQLLAQAVEVMTSKFGEYRIHVKPDSLASEDFAMLKSERTDFMETTSKMFSLLAPILQAWPEAMPHLIDLAKWALNGIKGGKEAEGIFDSMADGALKALQAKSAAPQQQPPNPEALKAQARMQEIAAEMQNTLRKIQAETQAQVVRDQSQAKQAAEEQRTAHELSMKEAAFKADLDVKKAAAIEAEKTRHAALRPLPQHEVPR